MPPAARAGTAGDSDEWTFLVRNLIALTQTVESAKKDVQAKDKFYSNELLA